MSPERMAAIAEDHPKIERILGDRSYGYWCDGHEDYVEWPCPTAELLAEVERLRAQVERVRQFADDQAKPFPDGWPDREGEAVRDGILAALAHPSASGLSDHAPTVSSTQTVNEPILCTTCGGVLCLDGWPERTDGDWMHVRDWKIKHPSEPAVAR